MPKGLKTSSSPIMVSASFTETAADTFTQLRVDLQLNPLDNEVFVVQAIDLNGASPDMNANLNSSTFASLSTTSRATIGSIGDSNVMAVAQKDIKNDGVSAVAFQQTAPETPTASNLDYIGIIATNDFFVQIQGVNNLVAKACQTRVYGYRATADASVYAALVQSEVLSS
jgi:hypothetical protein